MADLVRAAGDAFIQRSRKWITCKHVKVLLAIVRCRTAALGGHLDQCTRCGHRAISYNSCRNRHCPKCQAGARDRWLVKRRRELLPTPYVHVVFTLPRHLAPLALQNKKVVYDLLFRTSAETLLEVARDPQHLGAEIGFFSVLHTWTQKLELHPHVHCVVPAGGLSADRTRWIKPRYAFFLPVQVLSRIFRGKFVAALLLGSAPQTEQDTSGTKVCNDLWLCPSVQDRWWASRDSRLPRYNFVLHLWSLLPHETTLHIQKTSRASPRSVVVRLIAEQTSSSGFLGGSLRDIFSHQPPSGRAV